MKQRLTAIFLTIATFAMICSAFAQAPDENEESRSPSTQASQPAGVVVTPPAKELFHIYLLMGQSNMAGRGDPSSVPAGKDDPRILALNSQDQWVVARDPLHPQVGRIKPGVGPGLSFARQMVTYDPKVTIGMIPCAVGGTALKRWVKSGDLYEKAVARARLAAKVGIISGVLWHQGEADSTTQSNAESYGARLAKMVKDLRQDLDTPNLPIVVGQLGAFFPKQKAEYGDVVRVALKNMPTLVPNVGFADSAGLTDKGDKLHFNTQSQQEFGKRYAKSMHALQAQ